MTSVKSCALPDGALLGRFSHNGQYVDCYVAEISGSVALSEYVAAFYTSPVFKLERLILLWALSRPSTDSEARRLADGLTETFAAWRVESRGAQQLLLADLQGRTRSWFMVEPLDAPNGQSTALYFGSAVVPGHGYGFRTLLRFHKLYSVALLFAAKKQLEANRG